MTGLDWIIVGLYFIIVVIVGVYFNNKINHADEYYSGGRTFNWKYVGLSVLATQISTVTFIGGPGWSYSSGLIVFTIYAIMPLVFWLCLKFFLPFFYELKVVSVYEYIELRFDKKVRKLVALGFVIKILLVLGVLVSAPAYILSQITGLSPLISLLIVAIFTIIYTLLGGLKAIIVTDSIQMFIFWFGIVTVLFIALMQIDFDIFSATNYAASLGRLDAIDWSLSLTKENTFWSAIIGAVIFNLAYYGVDQSQTQRMLSSKSQKDLHRALNFSGYAVVVQMFAIFAIGIVLLYFYHSLDKQTMINLAGNNPNIFIPGTTQLQNANDVTILFILNYLPQGILGLIVVALFAGSMSSIDSAINSCVTVLDNDILPAKNKGLVRARILTIIIGAIVLVSAINVLDNMNSFLEEISSSASILLGPILAIFILGMQNNKTSSISALIAFIVGEVFITLIVVNTNLFWVWNPVVGLLITLITAYVVNLFVKNKQDVKQYTRHYLNGKVAVPKNLLIFQVIIIGLMIIFFN